MASSRPDELKMFMVLNFYARDGFLGVEWNHLASLMKLPDSIFDSSSVVSYK